MQEVAKRLSASRQALHGTNPLELLISIIKQIILDYTQVKGTDKKTQNFKYFQYLSIHTLSILI